MGLVAPLVLLLAEPLARLDETTFLAADLLQALTLFEVEPGHSPGNQMLSDPVVEMVPWTRFNGAELAAGRWPLWNPYNGCGVPHLANYQSAVLSPFALPVHLLGLKLGLLASAALKLLALAAGTYGLLRILDLARLPSLLGATGFAYCGHNVLLLTYPHAAVAAALPAALACAELGLRRLERGEAAARLTAPAAGFGASLLLGVLAGHPEPLYFAALLVALHTLVRLAQVVRAHPRRAGRPVAGFAWRFAAAGALAAGLTAWQTLPFLEYLRHSAALDAAALRASAPLRGEVWLLHAFPDLLGTPAEPSFIRYDLPPPNYETANVSYVGSVLLLLALLGLPLALRAPRWRALGLVAGLWPVLAYTGGAAASAVALGVVPFERSQAIWALAVASCAALAVDRAARAPGRAPGWAVATLALAVALLGAVLARLATWGPRQLAELKPHPDLLNHIAGHVALVCGLFAAAALLMTALWVCGGERARRALLLGLVAVVFLQSGFLMRAYNSVSEDRFVYPRSERVERLRAHLGGARLAVAGADTLPPDVNLVYGIDLLSSYDALGVRRLERLHERFLAARGNWRIAAMPPERALQLFGIGGVLSPSAVHGPGYDEVLSTWHTAPAGLSDPIAPGAELAQTFSAPRDGLSGLCVTLHELDCLSPVQLALELVALPEERLVARRELTCHELSASAIGRRRVLLAFAPEPASRGARYRLALRSSDGQPDDAVRAWITQGFDAGQELLAAAAERAAGGDGAAPLVRSPEAAATRDALLQGERELRGGLALELSYVGDPLRPVDQLGSLFLYLADRAAGRAHAVGRARAARSDEEAFALVEDPEHDPADAVVLGPESSGPPPPPLTSRGEGASAVEVLDARPGRWLLRARRDEPGWLVLRQTWYPGWRARVDGAPRALVQADYAFTAVPLEAGDETVELVYAPRSFRAGLWIAAASALLALAWCALHARERVLRPGLGK